jgi:hypothetical protein
LASPSVAPQVKAVPDVALIRPRSTLHRLRTGPGFVFVADVGLELASVCEASEQVPHVQQAVNYRMLECRP